MSDRPRPRLSTSQVVSEYQQALAQANAGLSASTQPSPTAPEDDRHLDVAPGAEPAQLAERKIASVGGEWAARAAARNLTPIPLALPQQPAVATLVGSNADEGDVLLSAAQSPDQPDSPDSSSDYDRLMQEADSTSDPSTQPPSSPDQLSQISWDDSHSGVLSPIDQETQFQTEDDQQFQAPLDEDVLMSDVNMSSSDIDDHHEQQLNELRKQISDLTAERNDLYQSLVQRDDTIERHAATSEKLNQEIKVSKTAAINAQYATTSLQEQLKEKAEQFSREKEQHDALKEEKNMVEIQNEKLRKAMYKANDMLKDKIDELEILQKGHDDLAAEVFGKDMENKDQAEEIENYIAQRQRDLGAIERLAALHNILATYLPLENTLDITTATPAEISGLIQQLADSDRSGSPDVPVDSPTELRINRLAGRPSTTRHVSLSDQLGDERLSESEGEEEEEGWKEEASATVAHKPKPAGLGLVDEKLPEVKKEAKNDTQENPVAIVADTVSAGQTAEDAAILAPSKPITVPSTSKPELGSNLSHYVEKKPSIDLLWYAWLFLGLITLLMLFVCWQERQLWHGANEFTRDAVVQHRGLRSMIFGKGTGAFWARQLRFEIERLIGVDTGVLG
ncbi:hypothetical protein MBLNU457_7751t2 [Dothideomycetes sp. NU457]